MPEGLPETFWDADARSVKLPDLIQSYSEAAAVKAERETYLASLPKEAKDYKIELKLPEGFKPPEGVELKIDDKDGRIPPLREFAKKHQLSQDALNDLIWLDAQNQLEMMKREDDALQAEFAKLGENGKTRKDAADAYLKANLSNDEYEALKPYVTSAVAFGAIEKLITKATAQRVPPGNEPPRQEQKPTPRVADRFYGQQKAS